MNNDADMSLRGIKDAIHNRGWIADLFNDYQLFPVIGSDKETTQYLSRETLGSKVVSFMVRRTNLSAGLATLVNSLTGVSLLNSSSNPSSKPSLVEEAYNIWKNHKEEQKTINDRVLEKYKERAKNGLAFSSIQREEQFRPTHPIIRNPVESKRYPYLPNLYNKINEVDDNFISIHGILCRVENASKVKDATIAQSVDGSGIKWMHNR